MTLLMPCIACFGRRLMAVAGPRILARRRATMRNGVARCAGAAGPRLDCRCHGPKATVYGVHAATAALMLAAATFLFIRPRVRVLKHQMRNPYRGGLGRRVR